MNIQEDFVSFETAKLLKEKGFDESCYQKYDNEGYLSFNHVGYINSEKPCDDFYALAPTQQMAMRWLREVHDLNINNELSIHGYFCSISHIVRDSLGHIVDVEDSESWETAYYDTYEAAVEAAIKYCLINLI